MFRRGVFNPRCVGFLVTIDRSGRGKPLSPKEHLIRNQSQNRGFALTEILAVVAAVAIVLGLVAFGGLSTAQLHEEEQEEQFTLQPAGEMLRAPVMTLVVTPDGKRVITGTQDRIVRIWDMNTGLAVARLYEEASPVRAIAVSPNSQDLVVASGVGGLTVWRDFPRGSDPERIEAHRDPIRCVAYSPHGDLIVSGSDDGLLALWSASTLARVCTFRGHTAEVRCAAFTPTGRFIISGSRDGSIKCWDPQQQKPLWSSTRGIRSSVDAIAVAPDGETYVAGMGDGTVLLGDASTGEEIQRFIGHTGDVKGVVYLGDGNQMASCSSDKTIRVWEVTTARELEVIRGHQNSVGAIHPIFDGRKLLSCGWDGTLRLWDRDGHFELLKFEDF